jgi:hypothetical protein
MEMGMKELTILNDCLRYSLGPPEKVLLTRLNSPIPMAIFIDLTKVMTLEGNV